MSVTVHIFAGKRWSGDATSALHAALRTGGIVLTEAGTKAEKRLRDAGVADVRPLRMSGLFGALNLSRMLRIVRPETLEVHSKSLMSKAVQAVSLSDLPVKVVESDNDISFEDVSVEKGNGLIWIGYITKECGLRSLLEALKSLPGETLKVVGEGEAKNVSPLLKMAKCEALKDRVEWVGEQTDVFAQMNGAKVGVITSANAPGKVVYKEFSAANLPVITGTSSSELIRVINELNEKNTDN